MKRTALAVSFLALTCAAASIPAFAGTIYTSGTTTGDFDAFAISEGDATTDQFTLSNSAHITGVSFVVWVYSGDALESVNWGFGLAKYGTGVASGTDAITTGTFLGTNDSGFDVYKETFSIPSTLLGAKTYWFTLAGADTVLDEGAAYWDENDGSSTGYNSEYGSIAAYDCANQYGCGLSGGETFTLTGPTTPAVPEPSSFLLLGTGLAGFAGLLRRKLKG